MLVNLRQGFASNSSSDHSIIISNRKWQDTTGDGMDFGWEQFICASSNSKMRYLAAQLFSSFTGMMPPEAAYVLACNLTGVKTRGLKSPIGFGEIGIDHQSMFAIPRRIDGGVNLEFIEDLKKFFSRPDVVVLGGNDNGDYPQVKDKNCPFSRHGSTNELFDVGGDWVGRKQKGVWSLFNRSNGTKLAFTFDKGKVDKFKPETPELVDMKITEVCKHACAYCYQHASINGMHAETDQVATIISSLRELEVFELVMGGGNVFMHPEFETLVEKSHDSDIVVNFTIRDPKEILTRPKMMELVKSKAVRRIAVSCRNTVDLEQLARVRDTLKVGYGDETLFAVNLIFEDVAEWDVRDKEKQKKWVVPEKPQVKDTITAAWHLGLPVTLLGYKSCGDANMDRRFGNTWIDRYSEVLGTILDGKFGKTAWAQLGVDTALAHKYSAQLKKAKVPAQLYYTKDGVRSWYIDAVRLKHGPSSYQPDLMTELVADKNKWGGTNGFSSSIKKEFQKVKP